MIQAEVAVMTCIDLWRLVHSALSNGVGLAVMAFYSTCTYGEEIKPLPDKEWDELNFEAHYKWWAVC